MKKFIMLLLVLLLAFCEPVTAHAITYTCRVYISNNNKGTFDAKESVTSRIFYVGGSETVDLMDAKPRARIPGWFFVGWKDDETYDETNELLENTVIIVSRNRYFSPVYDEEGYQVAFDLQDGSSPSWEMKSFGDEISEPIPTRDAFEFGGWYIDAECTGERVTFPCTVKGGVTFYAKWIGTYYEVLFLDEERNQIGETQQIEYGQYAKAPDDLTKEGHTFKGWNDGTETLSGEDIEERKVTGAVEYTAVFETNSYVVTFIADDFTENIQAQFNTPISKPGTPTRQGYDFAGWLTDKGKRWNFGTDTMPANNITLNASWDIRKFTVTFFEQDGLAPIGMPQTVNWGCAAVIETAPAIAGHVFDQWMLSGSDADEIESLTSVKEHINAIARYIKDDFTVTFIDDQGQVIVTHSVSAGSSATAPSVPEKEGYTFIGWNNSLDNVTGDMTVTAQYAVKTCTVRFIDDDGSELSIQTVNWNTDAIAPNNPRREGYTFTGWDKAFDSVTSDITVTAQYKRTSTLDNGVETNGELQNDLTTGTSHYLNPSSNNIKLYNGVKNGKMATMLNEGIPAASIDKDDYLRYSEPVSLDNRVSFLNDFSKVIIIMLCLLTALALGVSIWIVRIRKR